MSYLQKLMREKNISMYRLSQLSGIPKTTINDICTGKTSIERCSALNLKKIADVLNCSMEELLMERKFYTNVMMGERLRSFVSGVQGYEKRDCFAQMEAYLNSSVKDRVCVIYGLRRTGKTTMIRQAIEQMSDEMFRKAAYIKLNQKDKFNDLNKDLDELWNQGYRYVFLDEITLLPDFIDCASLFSDVYAGMGMKIFLSGTDSLGFFFTSGNELYDRTYTIHTTYIPFAEHSRLLGTKDIDEYIQYGGTLRMGTSDFDDKDLLDEGVSFRDNEATRKYIDTAIAKNIQNSLAHFKYGSHFRNLYELYDKNELTSAINRVIEDMNHAFVESVITREFDSHDMGITRRNLLKGKRIDIDEFMEKESVLDTMASILEIKRNKDALQIKNITTAHMEEIKEFLRELELTKDTVKYFLTDKGLLSEKEYTIFTQPGMRYCQAQALIYSLLKDEKFASQDSDLKELICERLLDEIKGRMLEDIILFDRLNHKKEYEDVFQLTFANGEFDMVVYNKKTHSCELYEVKHGQEQVDGQYKHFLNPKFLELTEEKFGEIKNKYVLYRGEPKEMENGITYLNVNDYLNQLYARPLVRSQRQNPTCDEKIQLAKEKRDAMSNETKKGQISRCKYEPEI